MDKKLTSIVGYLGVIGWFVAYFVGDREGAKYHLNQALSIMVIGDLLLLVRYIPFFSYILTWLVAVALLVFRIIGIVNACSEEEKEVPLFGMLHLIDK